MSSPYLGDESLPQPTEAQQRVIERIAVQRERLDARRAQRAHQKAELQMHQSSSKNAGAPLLLRAVALGRQYPVVLAALAGVALVAAGPKRVIRWVGVALPLVVRLRGR